MTPVAVWVVIRGIILPTAVLPQTMGPLNLRFNSLMSYPRGFPVREIEFSIAVQSNNPLETVGIRKQGTIFRGSRP